MKEGANVRDIKRIRTLFIGDVEDGNPRTPIQIAKLLNIEVRVVQSFVDQIDPETGEYSPLVNASTNPVIPGVMPKGLNGPEGTRPQVEVTTSEGGDVPDLLPPGTGEAEGKAPRRPRAAKATA